MANNLGYYHIPSGLPKEVSEIIINQYLLLVFMSTFNKKMEPLKLIILIFNIHQIMLQEQIILGVKSHYNTMTMMAMGEKT